MAQSAGQNQMSIVYTYEILVAVPSVMNDTDGHKATMQRDIAVKTKAQNTKKHVQPDIFSQVEGKQMRSPRTFTRSSITTLAW
jgi:hypothetical protein